MSSSAKSELHKLLSASKMSILPILFSLPFLFLLLLPPSLAKLSFLSPIQKEPTTLLYTLTVYLNTPPQPIKLHLDLGSSSFSWLDCSKHYNHTSRPIPCGTPLCNSFLSAACASNNTCSLYPENPITRQATSAAVFTDSLALSTTDGSSAGELGVVPSFAFSCAASFLLKGLAKKAGGLAALGRSKISLPAQVSKAFSSPRYFALCLPGSPTKSGVAFFGSSGPYYLSPGVEVSSLLIYTPLILNPVGNTVVSYGKQPSDEYFLNVTAVKVNGKMVDFNNSHSLLTIDENGFGGTKISTVNSFTILESSFYKAFVQAFVTESAGLNLTVTSAVKPFDVCYEANDVVSTRVGPGVPTVDLVMDSEDVFWRIFGWNSMVRITNDGADLWCLGFVDGGVNARTTVVIGGHQMEDNLVQFDLEEKRFGFSSSLLLKGTNCCNFNFN